MPVIAALAAMTLVGSAAFTAGWMLQIFQPERDHDPYPALITVEAEIQRTYHMGTGPVSGTAYSPDGRWLAATTSDGGVVVQQAAAGQQGNKRYTPQRTGGATGLTFNPEATTLAVGTSSGDVLLWSVPHGRQLAALGAPAGRASAITGAAFSPDGRILAAANLRGLVQLWDVSDPRHPTALATPARLDSVTDVAFDRRSATLAVGSIDGTVQLWDVSDPRHPEVLTTLESDQPVTSVGYSPDGAILAAGGSDGTTQFWNVHNLPDSGTAKNVQGRPASILPAANPQASAAPRSARIPRGVGSITGLVFTSNRRIAASTAGGYVQVWDINNSKRPKLLLPPTRPQAFTSLSYDTASSTLAIGAANGTVQVWAADADDDRTRPARR